MLQSKKIYYTKNGTSNPKYGIGWNASDINTGKRPLLPYDENIDGPRQIKLRPSNNTGITTWGLNEDSKVITPEDEAAINNYPTSTPISNNHSTEAGGAGGDGTILNTTKIIHHGYHAAHDIGTDITFLYKIPLKVFYTGIDYEANLKGSIRYYWRGDGSCTVEAPINARKKTDILYGQRKDNSSVTNIYKARTFFAILANKNAFLNLDIGQTQFIFARYSVWWPFDPELTTVNAGIDLFYPSDKLTQINSAAGVLGPLNENTGQFNYTQTFYNTDPINWGRVFTINLKIPISGKMNEDMVVIIGVTTGGWGSHGGSGNYGLFGGGNYDFYCQLQDINVNYSAGWSPSSQSLVDRVYKDYYVSSQDIGQNLSQITYLKNGSSTKYQLFTDVISGGSARRVKITNEDIANG